MELLKFIMMNVLGPVFEHDLIMVRERVNNNNDNEEKKLDLSGIELDKRVRGVSPTRDLREKTERFKQMMQAKNLGDAILEPNGPKLIDGYKNWILLYQFTGFINLSHVPLYVSIVYRLGAFVLANYIMSTHFVFKILFSDLLDINHANPIFILLTILTFLVNAINIVVIVYTSTFTLRPLFKILETPRLCLVNRRTQNVLGAATLKYMLIFYLYQCLLYRMMVHKNFEQFIREFNLFEFLLEYYATIVYVYEIVGLAHVDFYVRSCFGAWLLALKTNLECRRARFRRLKIKKKFFFLFNQEQQQLNQTSGEIRAADYDNPNYYKQKYESSEIMSEYCSSYSFISLDDIQKNLNTMDDHLEVTRSIQTSSLVMVNLLAFLGCGVLYLVAYDAVAKLNDYYHGTILVLLSMNYTFFIMLSYLGDSFVYYALGKLVQTVEDEYFLQESSEDLLTSRTMIADGVRQSARPQLECANRPFESDGSAPPPAADSHSLVTTTNNTTIASANNTLDLNDKLSLLTVRRSDVLFCREFIVQFEDHLATAWSKLTFKSHLHIMATYATLVAAQIIFDSH